MKLDVGCGENPKGDVNVDLFVGKNPQSKRAFINPKNIRNFVQADIHFLPFKDNAFEETFCYHVLEHRGVKVISAIQEMVRVTDGILEIEIPHRVIGKQSPAHDKNFSYNSFRKLLRRMHLSFSFTLTYFCIPHRFICLFRFPSSMRVRIPTNKEFEG